jgi:hypothetical protein
LSFRVKWVGMTRLMKETSEGIWFHDLDAWQNDTFDVSFGDFGVVKTRHGIGGSIFCRSSGIDIVHRVLHDIETMRLTNDEVSLNKIISELGDRFTILNSTYNLGSTGFENRLKKATLPAKILHFHPERNYDKFRNVASVTLLEVLFKHFCGS